MAAGAGTACCARSCGAEEAEAAQAVDHIWGNRRVPPQCSRHRDVPHRLKAGDHTDNGDGLYWVSGILLIVTVLPGLLSVFFAFVAGIVQWILWLRAGHRQGQVRAAWSFCPPPHWSLRPLRYGGGGRPAHPDREGPDADRSCWRPWPQSPTRALILRGRPYLDLRLWAVLRGTWGAFLLRAAFARPLG